MTDASTDPRRFLNHFQAGRRGKAAVFFYGAFKDGAASPNSIVQWVWAKAEQSRRKPIEDTERKQLLSDILDAIEHDKPGALAFAGHVIKTETVLKQVKMSRMKPTEKQREYLQRLGCAEEPRNCLEASDLIDRLLSQRNKG